jgi:NAD+ synthase (glutamine-hydrolysing)
MLLMSRGFVLGTGDMSEMAIGWCTYNGDHMSMYNVNCSIPKTLVKFLVDWVADNEYNSPSMLISKVLKSIVATEISPELLPLKNGKIVHSTEAIVGPYALVDFFMLHLVRNNFSPKKILILACDAFVDEYTKDQIKGWLQDFLKRFFQSQFKRSCVPDGPKVGSVSLSPRGDWRMPSDAEVDLWLKDLE